VCVCTVELTAHQLHAHGAGLAAHHGDDADVPGDDRRVEQVGLGAVVVKVTDKHLQRKGGGVRTRGQVGRYRVRTRADQWVSRTLNQTSMKSWCVHEVRKCLI